MESIELFLSMNSDYGDGSGSGYGSGYGDGYGSGSGYGDGDGDGSGSGYGDGYGDGDGYGSGSGYGDGDGDGSGDGDGVLSVNDCKVYKIDGMPTIIYRVRSNIAKGAILQRDMTLRDCYIAKVGNHFAHGYTAHKAYDEAQAKAMQGLNVEERIDKFCTAHSDCNKKYSYADLFKWHNILTGSCEFGRLEWCKEKGITENDSFTVKEFCELTRNAYGREIIRKIIERLNNENETFKKVKEESKKEI